MDFNQLQKPWNVAWMKTRLKETVTSQRLPKQFYELCQLKIIFFSSGKTFQSAELSVI